MEKQRKRESRRGRESLSDQGSQREDFILFYSMFPFLGSFPLRLSPLPVGPSSLPPRSLQLPPPRSSSLLS